MSHRSISVCPGTSPYAAYLEVRVRTADPLAWLAASRDALTHLLEYFQESDLPEGRDVRAYGVRLLSWLYPLPSQWAAGAQPLDPPPPYTENSGTYLTPDGLAIRFFECGQFEELNAIVRALLTLAGHCAYELAEQTQRDFFHLVETLLPSPADVAAQYAGEAAASGYRFDKAEQEEAAELLNTYARRAAVLRRALYTPAERLNARWLQALTRLTAEGGLSEADQNRMLDWVATGCPSMPDETDPVPD